MNVLISHHTDIRDYFRFVAEEITYAWSSCPPHPTPEEEEEVAAAWQPPAPWARPRTYWVNSDGEWFPTVSVGKHRIMMCDEDAPSPITSTSTWPVHYAPVRRILGSGARRIRLTGHAIFEPRSTMPRSGHRLVRYQLLAGLNKPARRVAPCPANEIRSIDDL